MKQILIIALTLTLINCSTNVNSELLSLRKENDSLKSLVSIINEKYVFDSVTVREIPFGSNTYKLGSKVKGQLVFVGYNSSENSTMVLGDSIISYSPLIFENSDTLELTQGAFLYETTLDSDQKFLRGYMRTSNDIGKDYEIIYTSIIKAN